MLTSIRRIAAAVVSLSRCPPHRSPSCRALATGGDPKPVLEIFKEHGFTDAQIDAIARKAPRVVAYRSGDLVGAKMGYLCRELGLDRSLLVKVVTTFPGFLLRSLANAIVPSVHYLVSLLGSRCRVIPVITRTPLLLFYAHDRVAANAGILKEAGVPDSSIAELLRMYPRTLVYREPERFRSVVDSALSAGFDPSAPMLVHAIKVKSSMSSSTREKKVGVYLSFGWSAQEIESAFRKLPLLFQFSEEHLRQKLHFLTNVLGMRPAEVLPLVKLMTSSLEGTLIPRCCVLELLMGKGLVKKDLNVPVALSRSKQAFARLFVEKYQSVVPQVLEAYQGKMRFSGFDHE